VIGRKLGPYEILAKLGEGGMGVVYRARDSRLQRDVAVKVLPDLFASDPERLARLEREAQVLASLTHPNIGHIYGLEDLPADAGARGRALILELIEGPTLADRIVEGAISIGDAIAIAKQIADALDTAHLNGIVHRDLKPANIKVRDDGTVKVLDFGLAKLTEGPGGGLQSPTSIPSMSPTMSAAFTGAGMILGTAAYMAPEQARGRAVDKRVDIWAFGCVLFEMLTSRRAFDGTDATEMIAAVVRGEPEWGLLPDGTTLRLRTLLERCLVKDPGRRLRDIGDVRYELDRVLEQPPVEKAVPVARASFWPAALLGAAALLVGGGIAGYAGWMLRPDPPRPIARFSVVLPEGQRFTNTGRHLVAISTDGTRIAYSANNQIFMRGVDQLEPVPVRGTSGEGNASGRNPFFSPDGEWLGFWQDGEIKKVPVNGGAPVTLCAATSPPWGARWEWDNTILFGQNSNSGQGILRVSGDGGMPELLVKSEEGGAVHGPQMLPGGRAVLFTQILRGTSWDQAQIAVESLDTHTRKIVVNGGTDARYLSTGHIVYVVEGSLFAVPFDVDSLETTGGPVPLIEGIPQAGANFTGAAHFDVAASGTLVYAVGLGATGARTLVWVDRSGTEEPLGVTPRAYAYPRVSPDGTRVALDVRDEMRDIWIWDLTRKTLTRLTLDADLTRLPVWLDAQRVLFTVTKNGQPGSSVRSQAADGSAPSQSLLDDAKTFWIFSSASPDGTRLIVSQGNAPWDIGVFTLGATSGVTMLLAQPFNESNAEISPDGRWLAFQSNETGRNEIYVRPFPNVNGSRAQVSTNGGVRPAWSRDGRELFYTWEDAMMAVPVQTTPGFKAGTPQVVFKGDYLAPQSGRTYDVSPDGKRFLMIKAAPEVEAPASASIIVVQNWLEELKRRVPIP
jgi:serine/threonine-protein kinase